MNRSTDKQSAANRRTLQTSDKYLKVTEIQIRETKVTGIRCNETGWIVQEVNYVS